MNLVGEPSTLEKLAELRGLGPALAQLLAAAGVDSVARLRQLGAIVAYLQVERQRGDTSLNLLYALEGAIRNEDWRTIAGNERGRLLIELDAARRASAS